MGIGKSGNIAEKVSSTLSSTDTPSIYINAMEESQRSWVLTKKDLLIIFLFWRNRRNFKDSSSCKKKVETFYQ